MSLQRRPATPKQMGFWDYFLLGAAVGALWQAFRNPGGCACCGGCLLLIGVLAFVLAVVAIERSIVLAVLVTVLGVLYVVWRKRHAAGQ